MVEGAIQESKKRVTVETAVESPIAAVATTGVSLATSSGCLLTDFTGWICESTSIWWRVGRHDHVFATAESGLSSRRTRGEAAGGQTALIYLANCVTPSKCSGQDGTPGFCS